MKYHNQLYNIVYTVCTVCTVRMQKPNEVQDLERKI